MAWLKKKLTDWLMPHDQWLADRFLAQAVDLCDLEWRMKEIARGRFQRENWRPV